jgi:hypothetical protein|tara:strand:- start:10757 stop:10876 length:120 start_codon:yes stop_codon:yes gene_type:complete
VQIYDNFEEYFFWIEVKEIEVLTYRSARIIRGLSISETL